MTDKTYIRLRQICLATLNMREDEAKISRILGQSPCHHSQLEGFGLENSLFAVGGSFIELVAPTREETAVHRFLTRTTGVGGYMAIFDCDTVSKRKAAAEKLGIRAVYEQTTDGADLLQLDPRATGITLVEFDHHRGGEDRLGPYQWAGDNWQKNINTDVDITGITMQCLDVKTRAAQWSELFEKPLNTRTETTAILPLDHGKIEFLQATGPEYFGTLHLSAKNPNEILQNAKAEGLTIQAGHFNLCGVSWKIHGFS